MKRITVLAYRNNAIWMQLADALVFMAKKLANKKDSELVVKVFPEGTEAETIDEWVSSLVHEHEIVTSVLDGTITNRFEAANVKTFNIKIDRFLNLTRYMNQSGNSPLRVSVEQVYNTCFERIATTVRPDFWVIVSNNITDYDPLGLKSNPGAQPTEAQTEQYVARFKEFIPASQTVFVCDTDGYRKLEVSGKKVVVLCHHHAGFAFGTRMNMIMAAANGSLAIETFPAGFLQELIGIIATDDLISGDAIEAIRAEILG